MRGKPFKLIEYLAKKDKNEIFELKEVTKGRSLNANSYSWKIMTEIANVLSISKDDVYKQMLRDYGQPLVDKNGCPLIISSPIENDLYKVENVYCKKIGNGMINEKEFYHYLLLKGSSQYSTKEMSIFIEGIVHEAKQLDIETLTPEELSRLKGLEES